MYQANLFFPLSVCAPHPTAASVAAAEKNQGMWSADEDSLRYRHNLVGDLLARCGVPCNLLGYDYLRQGILISLQAPFQNMQITKDIYPQVALQFRTTPVRVERSMRHVIRVMWDRGNRYTLEQIFSHTPKGRTGVPTNRSTISEFTRWISLMTQGGF